MTLRNILTGLTVLLLLLASVHCRVEALSAAGSPHCAWEGTPSSEPTQDCSTCCALEKAQVRHHGQRLLVEVPLPVPCPLESVLDPVVTEQTELTLTLVTASPEGLPQNWHFHSRMALPARAPSPLG